MDNYQDVFDTLASSDYYKIRKNSIILAQDEKFIKSLINVSNPFVFDRFTKMVQYKIDTSKLCEEREKYLEKVILDKNSKLPERWLTEDIISYFFQDNYYNFMTNLFQMVQYIRLVKKDLVSENNLKIYNEFVGLNDLIYSMKQDLFKKYYQKRNLMEMFYDDINKVREDSHQELTKKVLKLNKESDIYSVDLSRRLDVDVYYLDGESFSGFVRCLSIKTNDLSDHSDYVYSKSNRLGYSFSYISDKNIGTSDYDGKSVALFYDDIDYKNIMYMHHADLHAKKMKVQDDYLSDKENEILTPDSLIGLTKNYNEVYIKSDGMIKPKALICYDNISGNDITFAHKYNLAILLINKEKYKRYETIDDDYERYSYYM